MEDGKEQAEPAALLLKRLLQSTQNIAPPPVLPTKTLQKSGTHLQKNAVCNTIEISFDRRLRNAVV